MGEYRITLPKTMTGGFAGDPDQTVSNAGSPNLDRPLTAKNAIGIGVAAMYGKKVLSAGFNAYIGQMGNSEIERSLENAGKLAGYGALAYINPAVGIFAVTADLFVNTITYAVETHKRNLENENTIEARGTRIRNNAGGYYG